jgi:hypothetical protein
MRALNFGSSQQGSKMSQNGGDGNTEVFFWVLDYAGKQSIMFV